MTIRVEYAHLLGRPFIEGKNDCFSLARDFYKDNWGIEIRDYARPTGWEKTGRSLITEYLHDEGFEVVHEPIRLIRPGDGLLLAINAPFATHMGIYLGRDETCRDYVLDQQYGKLSRKRPFTGIFRGLLCAQVRHPTVYLPEHEGEANLIDLLPKHKQDEIRAHLKERGIST